MISVMPPLLRQILFVALLLLLIAGVIFKFTKKDQATPATNQLLTKNTPADIESTRIAIISDIDRCPSRKFTTKQSLKRFVDFANTQEVDFAISLGDNIAHRLEDCSTTAQSDLKFVMESFSSLEMPIHYVLGDHDISSNPQSYALWLEMIDRPQTYYSFDHNDVHIIVLDTVTGGDSLLKCEDDKRCSTFLKEKQSLEQELETNGYTYEQGKLVKLPENVQRESPQEIDQKSFSKKDGHKIVSRILSLQNMQTIHDQTANYLSDDTVRDHGLLGKKQLLWLSNDLQNTDKEKILILADHPLLPYTTSKKSYQINDLDAFTEILRNTKNTALNKEIVVIFGETHTWHKTESDIATYFGIDEFRAKDGSWAFLSWDKEFSLRKVLADKIDEHVN